MIPAPRIGRSDSSLKQQTKSANAVDCSASPELCKCNMICHMPIFLSTNIESLGESTGSSGGYAGSNDELVEPIDIQLRAAFIPRLGKRRVYTEEDNRASETNSDNKAYRKLVLIPGLGYIDADAANYAPNEQQEEDDGEATQRNTLIRSILESAKRAIPYTPRIGRAVFAPRIGKKATFVPRIG